MSCEHTLVEPVTTKAPTQFTSVSIKSLDKIQEKDKNEAEYHGKKHSIWRCDQLVSATYGVRAHPGLPETDPILKLKIPHPKDPHQP